MIFPSAVRSRGGAYSPSNSSLHHAPVLRLVARSVNQYCEITARTFCGGAVGNGLRANNFSTSRSFWSSRASVFTTQGRSEEHTSELQSRFGISYAAFCLK